ncbi:hypothetical protein BBJ29_002252 [Phytophthora kernoviae]|uniref:Shugoshin C-terminal domain-containing protein n=1 Tax=Phytophthora kernoviae TaxID=325452 RepID=A0A3F2RQG6_9STRA|nr:hypothetical protein BBJ29_002252 [Phytophthora kernoviae]RLN62281.1 hypothetical protein BBP00_00004854 [Phytophthora kernoviae]
MANGRSVAHVYSIMEELQQLRGKVSTLSEKNRQLAKALNTAKQEVVKAKVTQNAVFSDKVVEWMETRFKPGGVRDQSTQCTIREEIAGDSREGCLCLENIQLEPDSPFSPHWDNRPKSPRLSSPIVATATRKKAYTRNMHAKITEVAGTQGDYYGLGVRANRQGKERQSLKHRMISDTHKVKSGFKSAPFGQHCSPFHKRATRHVKRISYVEPKLNSKLRQVRAIIAGCISRDGIDLPAVLFQGDKFTFTT